MEYVLICDRKSGVIGWGAYRVSGAAIDGVVLRAALRYEELSDLRLDAPHVNDMWQNYGILGGGARARIQVSNADAERLLALSSCREYEELGEWRGSARDAEQLDVKLSWDSFGDRWQLRVRKYVGIERWD